MECYSYVSYRLTDGTVQRLVQFQRVELELHHHRRDCNNLGICNHFRPNEQLFDAHISYNLAI